jgi:hypothetical protein
MTDNISVNISVEDLANFIAMKRPEARNIILQACSVKRSHYENYGGGFFLSNTEKTLSVYVEKNEGYQDFILQYEIAARNNDYQFQFLYKELFYEHKVGKIYWIDDEFNFG